MKKTEWPIRWDLLVRYRLIEAVALWEGRLTTNHICYSFGIGRQQASKDINTYLRELAPGNLEYDRHLKGYVPSGNFKPVVTRGDISEYQELVASQQSLSGVFAALEVSVPNSRSVSIPGRVVDPATMRTVISALRGGRQLRASYVSLSRPEAVHSVLEPHTLVCAGNHWHVRAWCDANREFRDFAINRLRSVPELMRQKIRHSREQDDDWNREVTLEMMPDQRLSEPQQLIIANDYGMQRGKLTVTTQAALAPYILSQLGIVMDSQHPDPLVQQLELINPDSLGFGSKREHALKKIAARG